MIGTRKARDCYPEDAKREVYERYTAEGLEAAERDAWEAAVAMSGWNPSREAYYREDRDLIRRIRAGRGLIPTFGPPSGELPR